MVVHIVHLVYFCSIKTMNCFCSKGKIIQIYFKMCRSKVKITFPLMWTNSCCSHPMNVSSEVVEKDFEGNIILDLCCKNC